MFTELSHGIIWGKSKYPGNTGESINIETESKISATNSVYSVSCWYCG